MNYGTDAIDEILVDATFPVCGPVTTVWVSSRWVKHPRLEFAKLLFGFGHWPASFHSGVDVDLDLPVTAYVDLSKRPEWKGVDWEVLSPTGSLSTLPGRLQAMVDLCSRRGIVIRRVPFGHGYAVEAAPRLTVLIWIYVALVYGNASITSILHVVAALVSGAAIWLNSCAYLTTSKSKPRVLDVDGPSLNILHCLIVSMGVLIVRTSFGV